MSIFKKRNLGESQPKEEQKPELPGMLASSWHAHEGRVLEDAARDASAGGDHEGAEILRIEAGIAREKTFENVLGEITRKAVRQVPSSKILPAINPDTQGDSGPDTGVREPLRPLEPSGRGSGAFEEPLTTEQEGQ